MFEVINLRDCSRDEHSLKLDFKFSIIYRGVNVKIPGSVI